MQIFLDESGGLGVNDRYFVIAALCPQNPRRIKNIIKHACVRFAEAGEFLQEIKGNKLSFPERQDFIHKMTSTDDWRFSYIVADKQHLNPELLARQNICFNYLASFLIRPLMKNRTDDVHLYFDNRTSKVASGNSLTDYLQIQAYSKWNFSGELTVEYKDSKICKNIQAVDVLANTVYQYYEKGRKTFYQRLVPYRGHRVRFPHGKFGMEKTKIDSLASLSVIVQVT